jgi:hypothetical protein
MECIKQRSNIEYNLKELQIFQKQRNILGNQIELKSLEGINILFPNQEDCGKRIKCVFDNRSHVNCLVYGMTQTGKTGCMTSLIQYYILSNIISTDNIYIITGLSDKEWKKDTKNRLPDAINSRVFHRANLKGTFSKDIKGKKNVLVIMDEIQMAVGITSLLLWLMLTWSLGFILIRAFLEAIVAITSLAFMLVLVPEPV